MSVDCSIIIITFNTRVLTLKCVQDLMEYPSGKSFEIIVVDNASGDGTAQEIRQRFPNVKVIENPANHGFSKACNRGASQALGRYLCFLNSDTTGAGQAIDKLLAWMDQNPRCGVVGPEFRSMSHELIQMSWGWDPILFNELIQQYFAPYSLRHSAFKRRWVDWLQRKIRHVQILCGACLVTRREAFQQINGFDEGFELYFEDSDLCRRFRQKEWEVIFYPDAHVIHHLGQSTRESWSLTPLVYRQSQIYFYRKHASPWAMPLLHTYLMMRWFRLWIKSQFLKENQPRIRIYLSLFWKIIHEKEKIKLSGRYFDSLAPRS